MMFQVKGYLQQKNNYKVPPADEQACFLDATIQLLHNLDISPAVELETADS